MEWGAGEARGRIEMANENGNTSKSKKIWIALPVLAAVLAVGAFGYTYFQNGKIREVMQSEGIYPGVKIGGMDVAGMGREEALGLLGGKYTTEVGGKTLTLYYNEEEWEIPFEDMGVGYDVESAVEQAYLLGREGTEKERMKAVGALLRGGEDIEVAYTYDKTLLDGKLAEVAEEFDREAEDSKISRENGAFQITEEKEGRAMQREETAKLAAAVLETRESGRAAIAAEVTEPDVTYEDNQNVTDLLGSFSTSYSGNDRNRNNNLEVGCRNINGTVLAPGEVFSANVGLGEQTAAGGYKNAAVYNNGKVEPGMAGGVCQVTTTIYNAAIFAELEIVERHPHSMTVGYVPLGRDAAVAGNYKDLKIKNNTDYPVLIEASASGGKLSVNIYGHETRSAGRSLEFETVYEGTIPKPEEIVTEDPEMPEGEREVVTAGKTGCKVSVFKKVSENGKQISREWFSSSSYRSTADEVRVGTKAAEPAVSVPETPLNPDYPAYEEYPPDFYEGYVQDDMGDYHEF